MPLFLPMYRLTAFIVTLASPGSRLQQRGFSSLLLRAHTLQSQTLLVQFKPVCQDLIITPSAVVSKCLYFMHLSLLIWIQWLWHNYQKLPCQREIRCISALEWHPWNWSRQTSRKLIGLIHHPFFFFFTPRGNTRSKESYVFYQVVLCLCINQQSCWITTLTSSFCKTI